MLDLVDDRLSSYVVGVVAATIHEPEPSKQISISAQETRVSSSRSAYTS